MHQCSFHMSQTIIAVFAASHLAGETFDPDLPRRCSRTSRLPADEADAQMDTIAIVRIVFFTLLLLTR